MKYLQGNLLDQKPGILCHQVNLYGVMDAGLAKQIKDKWPHVFDAYSKFCSQEAELGKAQFVEVEEGLWVANLFGQRGDPNIETSTHYASYPALLNEVMDFSREKELPIYIPNGIGCGIARGSWAVMLPLIEFYAKSATLVIYQN